MLLQGRVAGPPSSLFEIKPRNQRRGLRVPDDVQVVGFDNVPEAKHSVPALTTIDPHIDDYAKHAVDMLIDLIEGYSGPARTYTTDFTLVERASTRLAH